MLLDHFDRVLIVNNVIHKNIGFLSNAERSSKTEKFCKSDRQLSFICTKEKLNVLLNMKKDKLLPLTLCQFNVG